MRVVSIWFPAWPITRLAHAASRNGGDGHSSVPNGRPFALVARTGNALTITAVNVAALREGVDAGMALADARAAVPTLLTSPAEVEADRAALLSFARWVGRYGPNRNTDGDDGLWVEITGVAHLFGGEMQLLDDMAARFRALQVPAKIGLADTPGAAHALARYGVAESGGWARAGGGASREALSRLPVDALRLDAPRVLLLKRLGLRRIGQLFDIPRDSLARRFRSKESAAAVLLRLDQALGVAAEPRRPLAVPPDFSAVRAFAEPLLSSEAIEHIVAALSEELTAMLAERGMGAKTIRLMLFRADATAAQTQVALSRAVRDGPHLFALLRERLDTIDAGFGVDLVRLEALHTLPFSDMQAAFETAIAAGDIPGGDGAPGITDDDSRTGDLVDRLSNRFGPETVLMPGIGDSHIPERAEQRRPAIDVIMASRPGHRTGGQTAPVSRHGYVPPWPYGPLSAASTACAVQAIRPAFLLPAPEPIRVVAEVPDGPPIRFTWRRVDRRVLKSEGPERIAPEWWLPLINTGDASFKRPRPRDYYCVEDLSGARYWVFRHGLYQRQEGDGDDDERLPEWFMHGLFA